MDSAEGSLKAVRFLVKLFVTKIVWLQSHAEYFLFSFLAKAKTLLLFMDLSIHLGTFVSCSNVHCLLLENERILLAVVIILHFL